MPQPGRRVPWWEQKGMPNPATLPESKAKLSVAALGNAHAPGCGHCSPETRAKTAASLRGRPGTPHTAEFKAVMSQRFKGFVRGPQTEAHKKKNADAQCGNQRAKGNKFSAEAKQRLSDMRRGKKHPEGCNHCLAVAQYNATWPKPETSLEATLYRLLTEAGYEVEKQRRFGKYVVDIYVPSLHVAFEADGATWHSYPAQVERDSRRDAWLAERFDLPVVRLREKELRKMAV